MIEITFPDGKQKEFQKGISASEIAKSISASLAKRTLIALVDGEPYDLNRPLVKNGQLTLVTDPDNSVLKTVLNHSCAHLLASAIKEIYPLAMFGVGPTIEEGFYYDMDLGAEKISEIDLPVIETKMHQLANQGLEITRQELSKDAALSIFSYDKYKLELINDLPDTQQISVYRQGNFTDLCRGPHLPNTKFLKHFKLLSVSGAYFRGDSQREQLQRVYGICFMSEEELTNYLAIVEERKKRDHRKLGKDLDLFMISEYGPGFPFWLAQGTILKRTLEDFWYDIHLAEGYQLIQTPIMLNQELWKISGHWDNYRENMYTSEIDKHDFAIKPMNCPGGILVYKHNMHSYKDFPLKIGELGLVHRHEPSGSLTGLFRVRNFTQDDAHIFLTEKQLVAEIITLIHLFDRVYRTFDLSYQIELSTRPEKNYIGEIATWDWSEQALAQACHDAGKTYVLNPGDGAFYGPKLDFKIRDSMGRIWQCGTIQLDMNLPGRFDLTYVNEKGEKARPIMLHRAIFGSLERFIGVLLEHYGGALPLWLAPRQFIIIPVNVQHHLDYALELKEKLLAQNFRVEVDERAEKMNYKIRESLIKKVPITIIVGNQEKNEQSVTYRKHGSTESKTLTQAQFFELIASARLSLGKIDEL